MNIVKSGIIAVLFAFLPLSSFAEPDGLNSAIAPHSVLRAQFAPPVKNTNPISGNLTSIGSSAIYIPDLGESTNTRSKIISVHSYSLSGGIGGSGMLANNDHVYSSIYVPMQGVNNALSIVETALQSKLADSLVTLVQAIFLVAKRQENSELSYSVGVNDYSRIDFTISYRLHPGINSLDSEAMASLRYNSRF